MFHKRVRRKVSGTPPIAIVATCLYMCAGIIVRTKTLHQFDSYYITFWPQRSIQVTVQLQKLTPEKRGDFCLSRVRVYDPNQAHTIPSTVENFAPIERIVTH